MKATPPKRVRRRNDTHTLSIFTYGAVLKGLNVSNAAIETVKIHKYIHTHKSRWT